MKHYIGRLLLLLLALAVCSGASAQERLRFHVAEFGEDLSDFSAKSPEYEKYDSNGDRYAIIKVSSLNPGDNLAEYNFNFGNLRHLTEMHDDVLWIYVQRNAKQVTIQRPGYASVNRYDLHTTIAPGKNYVMTLSAEDKKVLTQMTQFIISPAISGATILVTPSGADAQEEVFGSTDVSGAAAKNLVYGTYSYKVIAPNYHVAEGRFTLDDKNTTHIENVTLRSNAGELTLVVDAPAEIWVNGTKMGTRQWSGKLRAGQYSVECRQPNHLPSSQYIEVAENDRRTITLAKPQPILGTLSVTSSPLNAAITVDGVEYGKTPQNFDVVIGSHTVTLSADGYTRYSVPVTVKKDETTTVSATLTRGVTANIKVSPSYSEVTVDGEKITPDSNGRLVYSGQVGNHKFKITSWDEDFRNVTVNKYIGANTDLFFYLPENYIKKRDFYIEANLGYTTCLSAGATMGFHLYGFNFEGFLYGGFASESVEWFDVSSTTPTSLGVKEYKPEMLWGFKAGYAFRAGSRWRITPQVGFMGTKVREKGDDSYYSKDNIQNSYRGSVTFGCRVFVATSHHFGFSLTPEYAVSAGESDGFKMLADVNSNIKNLGQGFSIKLGCVLAF